MIQHSPAERGTASGHCGQSQQSASPPERSPAVSAPRAWSSDMTGRRAREVCEFISAGAIPVSFSALVGYRAEEREGRVILEESQLDQHQHTWLPLLFPGTDSVRAVGWRRAAPSPSPSPGCCAVNTPAGSPIRTWVAARLMASENGMGGGRV